MIEGDLPFEIDIGISTGRREREEKGLLDIEFIQERLETENGSVERIGEKSLMYKPSDRDLKFKIYKHGGLQILGRLDSDKLFLESKDENLEEMKKKFWNHISKDFEKMLMNLVESNIDGTSYHTITEDYDLFAKSLEENDFSELKKSLSELSILDEEEPDNLVEIKWLGNGYKLKDKNGLVRYFIWDTKEEIEVYYLGDFLYDDSFKIDFLNCVHRYEKEVNPKESDFLGTLESFTSDLSDERDHISLSLKDYNLEFYILPIVDGTKIICPNANSLEELVEGVKGIGKVVKILKNEKRIKDARKYAEDGRLKKATRLVGNINNVLDGYSHPTVNYIEGIISFHDENYDEALKKFKKAHDRSEKDSFVEPLNKKAEIHIQNGEYEEAHKELNRSLNKVSDQSEIKEKLEEVEMRMKIKDELEQAKELEDQQGTSQEKIKKNYEEGKEKLEKEEVFSLQDEYRKYFEHSMGSINEKLRKAFKDNYHPLDGEAKITQKTNEILEDKRKSSFGRNKNKSWTLRDGTSVFYIKEDGEQLNVYFRDIKGAQKCLEEIKEVSNDSPESYCLEGLISFYKGEYEKAIELLEKASDKSEKLLFLDPMNKMADAQLSVENYDDAKETLNKIEVLLENANEVVQQSFEEEEIQSLLDINSQLDKVNKKRDKFQQELTGLLI